MIPLLNAREQVYREALELQRKTLGGRHQNTLTSSNNLCLLLKAKGDLGVAELLCREALDLEGRRETLSDRHPSILNSMNSLGWLLQAKGDTAAAKPLLRGVMARS